MSASIKAMLIGAGIPLLIFLIPLVLSIVFALIGFISSVVSSAIHTKKQKKAERYNEETGDNNE